MKDRRLYLRIMYQAQAYLTQKDKAWPTEVIDLSLKGVLLKLPKEWEVSEDKLYQAKFQLRESAVDIYMELKLLQEDNKYLHLSIEHIDIESASHLKRLIELNAGDENLLHRELAQLMFY